MPGLRRRLQRTNKDQYTLTIPKQLVQLLGWAAKQQIIFGFEKGRIQISPVEKPHEQQSLVRPSGIVRALQKTPKDQYLLTVPKALVQLLGWKDKQEILFGFEKGKITLEAGKSGGDAHE